MKYFLSRTDIDPNTKINECRLLTEEEMYEYGGTYTGIRLDIPENVEIFRDEDPYSEVNLDISIKEFNPEIVVMKMKKFEISKKLTEIYLNSKNGLDDEYVKKWLYKNERLVNVFRHGYLTELQARMAQRAIIDEELEHQRKLDEYAKNNDIENFKKEMLKFFNKNA